MPQGQSQQGPGVQVRWQRVDRFAALRQRKLSVWRRWQHCIVPVARGHNVFIWQVQICTERSQRSAKTSGWW